MLISGQTPSPLRATAHYNNYEVQNVTASAQYTSSNPGVAAIDPATHTVNAVQPGIAQITAVSGGKQATFRITVIAASDAVQVTSTVKTPSGVVPVLPGVVNAVYHNQPVQPQVTGSELAGLDFSTIGTVQIPVTLKINNQEFFLHHFCRGCTGLRPG
ncbi:Ig-like domain-containing protein [Paenibacillus rhizoplanae]